MEKLPNLGSRAITGDAGKSSVTMKWLTPLRIRTSPINRTRNINPDEGVAYGTAVQAAILSDNTSE
jgi:hypothetical protein